MAKTVILERNSKPVGFDQIHFAVLAVESGSRLADISANEMLNRLDNVGLVNNYVIGCYDVFHTMSLRHVSEDTVGALDNWERDLPQEKEAV